MNDTDPKVPASAKPTGQTVHAAPSSTVRAVDLVRYREAVETLMQVRSGTPISNGLPAHAAILFEKFLKHAKEHVRIFCKNLSAEVFDDKDLIEQAKWALLRNVKISVITQEEPEKSAFRDLLLNSASNSTLLRATGSAEDIDLNFAVMDQEAVRVEPDRKAVKAQAIMSIPHYASDLVRAFDQMVYQFSPSRLAAAH